MISGMWQPGTLRGVSVRSIENGRDWSVEAESFDNLTRAFSSRLSRRRTLKLLGLGSVAIAGANVGVSSVSAACQSATDCDPGMICDQGFCYIPGCLPSGSTCASHDDCCDDDLCLDGVCGAGARCVLEAESCASSSECCPGMECAGGICVIPIPEPEPNGGGGGTGNENSGGDGGNTSNGGGSDTTGTVPTDSGNATSVASTSSGVAVASLPNTGTGTLSTTSSKWKLFGLVTAGGAALVGLRDISSKSNLSGSTDSAKSERFPGNSGGDASSED
jgi:hypothetical protein